MLNTLDLEIIASFPLWKKEFEYAYSRLKKYLDDYEPHATFKLYRGLYLSPETKTLYNYKAINSPETLYKILENEYNSTTTDVARALYFAMDPTTKTLNQNSLIFEMNVQKDLINFPYTMYLNGKNGKYGECELNILMDNQGDKLTSDDQKELLNKKVTNIAAYIGPKSINELINNNIEENIDSSIKRARSSSNQSAVYYIDFKDQTIKYIDHDTSKDNIIYTIKAHKYCNINNKNDIKKYYVFIVAEYNSNQTYFIFDRFTNTVGKCKKTVKKINIDSSNIKNIDLKYDNGEYYQIEYNGEQITSCKIFEDFSLTRDYNSKDYDIKLKEAIIDMLVTALGDKEYSKDKNVLDNFKKTIKTIYKIDDEELNELVKTADNKNFNNEVINDSKNILNNFIKELNKFISNYKNYITIKNLNTQLDNINPNNITKLNDILNTIEENIKFNIENESNLIKQQNELKNNTKQLFEKIFNNNIIPILDGAKTKYKSSESIWLADILPIIEEKIPDETINNKPLKTIFKILISNVDFKKLDLLSEAELDKSFKDSMVQIIDTLRNKEITIEKYEKDRAKKIKTANRLIFNQDDINYDQIKANIEQFENNFTETILINAETVITAITENNEYLANLKTENSIVYPKSESRLVESFYTFLKMI